MAKTEIEKIDEVETDVTLPSKAKALLIVAGAIVLPAAVSIATNVIMKRIADKD